MLVLVAAGYALGACGGKETNTVALDASSGADSSSMCPPNLEPERVCATDGDCATASTTLTHCCGGARVYGVSRSSRASFAAALAACDAQLEPCTVPLPCPLPATVLDEQMPPSAAPALLAESAVPVQCRQGQCTTYWPDPT